MYSKLDKVKKNSSNVPDNAGSCVKLASYLDKEKSAEKSFFSHNDVNVPLSEVIDKIDNNKKTLKKYQEKFYSLSYNPSVKEVKHLVKQLTGKNINELSELTAQERAAVFDEFRNYVRDCMNVYAKNFNRERELSGNDLVYFGRIEEFRYYTGEDEEVKLGLKKQGEKKPGINLHAHVIVSRMDVTQTVALSPRSASRGNINMLNGKAVKNGFNMKQWQVDCFESFGSKYRYLHTQEERFFEQEKGYSEISNQVSARMKNKIIQEALEGMEEERKLLKTANKITTSFTHPKKVIRNYLKNKIKNILLDREPVI